MIVVYGEVFGRRRWARYRHRCYTHIYMYIWERFWWTLALLTCCSAVLLYTYLLLGHGIYKPSKPSAIGPDRLNGRVLLPNEMNDTVNFAHTGPREPVRRELEARIKATCSNSYLSCCCCGLKRSVFAMTAEQT